jgi:hypothetical protein
VEGEFQDLDTPPPWWRLGFDGKALLEAVVGSVVGLIALFSSYDHVSFPGRVLPLPQQWGVWLIAASLPLVVADAQLAARSRRRDADRALRAENEAARERLALLNWMHSEIDLIEADLPSSSSPPQATAANSYDC